MSDNDQSDRNPGTYHDVPIVYNNPWDAVRADDKAENTFVSNMGVLYMHYRAIPCPLGESELGSLRHTHDHDEDVKCSLECENGFLYVPAGEVWGMFQSNSKKYDFIPPGYYGNSVAVVTFNRYYRDTEKTVAMAEWDKLIPLESPKEFFFVDWQKVQHNPTGIDRTQFKICEVEMLVDSRGVIYNEGPDFFVNASGFIEWVNGPGAKRPGIDNNSNKGTVYSVRYKYRPYFYVKAMLHELRIKPVIDELTGEVMAKSGPIQAAVQADWVFLDGHNTKPNSDDARLEPEDTDNTGPR